MIVFGRFCLDPRRRVLLADGAPVRLQSRAFDILLFLLTHRDAPVTRDDIIARIWQGQAVTEANLTVQMSNLRRVLADHGGEGLVITTNRAYHFVGDVQFEIDPPAIPKIKSDAPHATASQAPTPPSPKHRRRWHIAATLAALPIAAGAALLWRHETQPPQPPRLSIVVMPFRDLSDDHSADYLADAISDDLTTDLAHIQGSLVIARATADGFKGHLVPIDEVGRQLNVRYALEGSIRAEGATLHMNAQLIDATTNLHLWSERWDVPRDKVADTRDTIVRRIASTLDGQLIDIEANRSFKERPNNPDVQDLVLRARYITSHKHSAAGTAQAQHMLEQALAISPDSVDALTDLGQLLVHKVLAEDDTDTPRDLEEARRLLAKGNELAPRNPRMLNAESYLHRADGDIEAARTSLLAALAADSNFTAARRGLASCDWQLGRYDEQLTQLQLSMREDPLGPTANERSGMMATALFMLGRYDEALPEFERSLADAPPGAEAGDLGDAEWDHMFIIATLDSMGEKPRAQAEYKKYARLWPNRSAWRLLAYFTAAQARTRGLGRLRDALVDAGMPPYDDEHRDDGVPPTQDLTTGGDFEATPTRLPGGTTIDVAGVRKLLASPEPPIIVDVGRGAAVATGALWEPSATRRRITPIQHVIDQAESNQSYKNRNILVIGTGVSGRNGYQAALRLVNAGLPHVYWFRGGEEGWAAAHLPAEDRRVP